MESIRQCIANIPRDNPFLQDKILKLQWGMAAGMGGVLVMITSNVFRFYHDYKEDIQKEFEEKKLFFREDFGLEKIDIVKLAPGKEYTFFEEGAVKECYINKYKKTKKYPCKKTFDFEKTPLENFTNYTKECIEYIEKSPRKEAPGVLKELRSNWEELNDLYNGYDKNYTIFHKTKKDFVPKVRFNNIQSVITISAIYAIGTILASRMIEVAGGCLFGRCKKHFNP